MTRLRYLAKWLYWWLSGPSTEHLMMGDPRELYDEAIREHLKREPKR
jgi:hypothetical protein